MTEMQGFEYRLAERLRVYAAPAARPPEPAAVARAVAAKREARRGAIGWLRWPPTQLLSYGAVAALGLLAVVLAFGVWGGGGIGPGGVSPSPSPTPSPRSLPSGGLLESGTYLYPSGQFSPVAFTFAVPEGWVVQNFGANINKHVDEPDELGFGSFIVRNINADACAGTEGEAVDAGTTVNDLVNALLDQSGPIVEGPFDVTLDGYPGQRLDLASPPGANLEDCTVPGDLQLWQDQAGNYLVIGADTASIYIVDVDRTRFVMTTGNKKASPATDVAELEAIVESIEFQP